MKKFNWAKRGATAVVMAGLLATAMPATALAEGGDNTKAPAYNEQGYMGGNIEKTWQYNGTNVDAEHVFQFTLTQGADGYQDAPINGNPTATPVLKEGNAEASVTISTKDENGVGKGSAPVKNLVDKFSFTKPGQYHFTLKEVDDGNKNIDFDEKTYVVRVDVVWDKLDETVKIDGIYVLGGNENLEGKLPGKLDSADFVNKAPSDLGTFKFTKVVSGTAANTSDTFQFKVTLGGNASGKYAYTVTDGQGTTVNDDDRFDGEIETNKEETVTLKHNETLTINGLPDGATWKVVESGNEKGYTLGELTEGKDKLETGTASEDNGNKKQDTLSKDTLTAEGKIVSTSNDNTKVADNDSVVFRNDKGFVPDTGITMNTLPFVAVAAVAVAGGVTLIISRNRRAHEDF